MRLIESTTPIWWAGGVASTDVAAIQGCAAESRENPLVKWAEKVWMRERSERKTIEAAVRKETELEQGTPEWHRRRKTGIGGTEAAALVGASYGNRTTAGDVWADKVATTETVTGENAAMARGKSLEPIARSLYEQLYGWSVPPACVLHDRYDFVRASLDGLRGDDKLVVEIKCCGVNNHNKLLRIQQIEDPLERQTAFDKAFGYYECQVQYQLLITEADICHFVGFNDDFQDHRKLAVIEIYPDPETQERILNRVVDFWSYVERREPPPIEWSIPCHRPPKNLRLPPTLTPTPTTLAA